MSLLTLIQRNNAPSIPTKPGDFRTWSNLQGSANALAIAETSSQHAGLTVVICTDNELVDRLAAELRFYTKDTNTSIVTIPDWEILPYDSFSPHQDIISERIETLYRLPAMATGILLIPLSTLYHRIAPKSHIIGSSFVLSVNESLDIQGFRRNLESAGYRCTDTVFEHGEFAVRGSLLDLYPMGSPLPFRIELLDDEVDTIRTFDPESQRSINKVEEIRLLPAREFPLDEKAIAEFKTQWRETFDVDHRRCPMYNDISDGIAAAGIEYYLPLFFQQTETIFNYLPENCLIFTCGDLNEASTNFWQEVNERHENLRYDIQRPILDPGKLFVRAEQFFAALKNYPKINLTSDKLEQKPGVAPFHTLIPPDTPVQYKSEQPYKNLKQFIEQKLEAGYRILFCAESAGRRETLLEHLSKIDLRPKVVDSWQQFARSEHPTHLIVGPLQNGLELTDLKLLIITESQLFGEKILQRRRREKETDSSQNIVRNLTELNVGAPVVHVDHGVGRYLGLQTINVDDQNTEFLTLEYANNAKLYVPVSSLHLISRYGGVEEELAPLHKLGSEQWQKEKRKAAEKIRDTAAELLNIYSMRAAQQGHAFQDPGEDYEIFASGFPYEETPDQVSAINATLQDMLSPQPMDRLICGDVGFGKTEVAMRAAFIAVQNGKQVAVLVPTTLLAQQHFESFKDRFADWPVQIEVLSRFKSQKQQSAAVQQLAAGKLDIVIGTHKLLQESIDFKSLGLIIVDEEHRFGVRHKERLKSLRANCDILTLTATPIPRTLNMAMSGIRDMSIIATPPAKRLSVKTFVREHNTNSIKEAILRELLRGGQVYYLHNEVKTIEKCANELEQLIPEARIGIAHGQMRERQLEQVMSAFYHKQFNVLVCTTIIETGIDVPTANTIIMDRADKLGLAQLHQLRGRVGRSHHQAYAYLMTANRKAMSGDAQKRLDAIAEAHDLGAGFTLASHDLEIRGTGELLGEEQSGHIHSIGFTLYMEMLDRAVAAIKEGKTPNLDKPLDQVAEVNLRIPALIDEDYLGDVHNRLILYKRIASAENNEQLESLHAEMIDRFGPLPDACKNLLRITQIKLTAQAIGITKIDASASGGRFEFDQTTEVDPYTIVELVQTFPQQYALEGASKLKFKANLEKTEDRFQFVQSLLDQLAGKGNNNAATSKKKPKRNPSASP